MRRLLVFLKYPTPGQVKTRLAAHVGEEAASEIYRACAELTLHRLRMFRRDIVLCVDPPEAAEETISWLGPAWALQPQRGATLGERLAEATATAFRNGAQRVVVVGTDSPWLNAAIIEQAFAALESADVAVGPTDDGGYYLIGLGKAAPGLFEGIAWSTPRVYEETAARAQSLGLTLHPLPMGYDVDRMEDLRRFVAEETAAGSVSTHVKILDALSVAMKGGGDA